METNYVAHKINHRFLLNDVLKCSRGCYSALSSAVYWDMDPDLGTRVNKYRSKEKREKERTC